MEALDERKRRSHHKDILSAWIDSLSLMLESVHQTRTIFGMSELELNAAIR